MDGLDRMTTDELKGLGAQMGEILRALDYTLCGWISADEADRLRKAEKDTSRRAMASMVHAINGELARRGE